MPKTLLHSMQVSVLGLVLFGISYLYTSANHIPNPLNKSVADTAVLLMGLSMLLSSICYFWNFLDSKIVYRKYLGLIGFAFALVHVGLSFGALQRLFLIQTWQQQTYWPALTGLIATIIFALMTLVSNQLAAKVLGGKTWKFILHLGYLAMAFVLAHVVLLKFARWQTWWANGLETPPAMSLIITGFIVIVLVMRVLLAFSLKKKTKNPEIQ